MEIVDSSLLQALVLTKNEEPNLARVLSKLTWLNRIIILDSYSTDTTLEIARSFPNTIIFQREFDTHAKQWNHGLSLVDSTWVLTLDADYVLTDELIKETKQLIHATSKSAYLTNFRFLVFGRRLLGDNTTPRPVLFKKPDCIYFDDGHTQRLKINGDTDFFKSYILHDDRKSLSRWLSNLDGYSIKESKKLLGPHETKPPTLADKVRKTKVLAPFLVFFYCLFVKGLIFSGWPGWHYTLQRTMVEILFALRLIEEEKLS